MASGASKGRLWLINGLIAAVVVLAIIGTVIALTMGSQNSTEGLRTTMLGRGTVAEVVTASGTVTTSRNATVNFNVTGRLASVRVKLGDRVRKGQVLATLDARFAKQNAEAASLRVDADEKQVAASRKRVAANKQALDAAEAAADVPINERSGASGATGGSSGQTAMPGMSPSTPMAANAPAAGGDSAGQAQASPQAAGQAQQASPQAAGQPQVAQPPAKPQAAPATQAAPAPAPQPVPVQPPWWCFWCNVTYVYPPAPTTPPASATPTATMPMPTSSAPVPSGGATPSAGAGAAGASQGPSKKQRNATEEQDDANVKAAKAQLAESEATLAANEATLAQDRANLISARNSVDDIELIAPQDGAVATLDGQVGQIVGPQGIVLSGTDTGNPTGGRLPDGTAVTSGAQGNGTSSSGSSGGGSSGDSSGNSGGGDGSGSSGGGTSSGGNGTSVTASPVVPAVLTLIGSDQMQVRADVPELDIGRVANGQQVDVRVNALPEDKVGGTVASVNLLPGSGTTVQYGTNVALPAPPRGLRVGMSANVSITTRSVPNVPFLPSSAIRSSGEGATTGMVDVLAGPDNRRESRTIGLGLSSDSVTEVTSGLQEGEVVVLPDPPPSQFDGGGG